jgi:exopolyphosphatase / guanosine-5'-triphosphate,3'-diphosphate pyrophosphatase
MSIPITPAFAGPPPAHRAIAVIDIGASAVRLVVAEVAPGERPVLLEEASRAVSLGKDTFSAGRIGARTMEAALKALGGFRALMDGYGVTTYRAVATSAVREAANADTFLDRVRVRTGIDVEVIDGAEESRLTYLAVRDRLGSHPAMRDGLALLVEVGAGSADLTMLDHGQPIQSGVYPLGAIRMRQSLGNWQGSHEQRIRLMTRHVLNVVGDIREEMPLASARHMVALGHDVRFAASQLGEPGPDGIQQVERERFIEFCQRMEALDQETIADRFQLAPVDAETLAPALLVGRSLLAATAAESLTVPDVSLRAGLLVDLSRPGDEPEFADFSRQVLASAAALGEKYRYDAPHARQVARLAARLFDELHGEHGLASRDRLLLEVAALLHDIGIFVSLRAHHKHSQYLLTAAEIFGLASEDQVLVGNVARYHRRGLPQKTHLPYMELDREDRVRVNKLAAILRVANALDAEHMQKITDLAVRREDDHWVLEVDGAGDLTMERLAVTSRADLLAQVFGHDLLFRIKEPAS